MIRGLTQVPWERVDVSFQKSSQRLIAHNTIQVQIFNNFFLFRTDKRISDHFIKGELQSQHCPFKLYFLLKNLLNCSVYLD